MDKLTLFCAMHGADLAEIEAFVAELELARAPVGDELRERLKKARAAVTPLNGDKAKRHIEWIVNRMLEIRSREQDAPHIARGKKVLKGAQAAHVHTHGTLEEKQKQWDEYQRFIDEKHAEKSLLSYEEVCNLAATYFKVSLKTIKRHTSNWKQRARNQ